MNNTKYKLRKYNYKLKYTNDSNKINIYHNKLIYYRQEQHGGDDRTQIKKLTKQLLYCLDTAEKFKTELCGYKPGSNICKPKAPSGPQQKQPKRKLGIAELKGHLLECITIAEKIKAEICKYKPESITCRKVRTLNLTSIVMDNLLKPIEQIFINKLTTSKQEVEFGYRQGEYNSAYSLIATYPNTDERTKNSLRKTLDKYYITPMKSEAKSPAEIDAIIKQIKKNIEHFKKL